MSFSKKMTLSAAIKFLLLAMPVAAFALPACVTVNVPIVFPESSVQKATDDYVRDIYRAKEKGKTPTSTTPAPAKKDNAPKETFLDSFFIPSAWAIEAVFKVDSEKAMRIRESLSARVAEVLIQKRNGVLGETNAGLLVVKKSDQLKDLLRKKIEKMVSDENKDREKLYEEIARINSVSERSTDIRRSFARSFQAESPSGTWIQDSDGNWSQKQ